MKKIYYFLQTALILFLAFPLALLPFPVALRLGEYIGKLGFRFWRSRRIIAIEAIEKTLQTGCFSSSFSAEDIARMSFEHLGRSFMEILKVYITGGTKLMDHITIEGLEHLKEAKEHNRGVLIITGHYSNWELLALTFGHKISKAYAVARKQNNPFLNYLIENIRQRFGNIVIYKAGALKKIISVLKENAIVGILYDQCVVEDEGIIVDFLCRPAWTMKIPVMLSQKTGAPLLPVFMKKTQSGYTISINRPYYPEKETELKENIRIMNSYIETEIKNDPTQWLWIHRRWKRIDS